MVSVSGVRGTIGGTLTPEVACQFGCAMGTMLRQAADGGAAQAGGEAKAGEGGAKQPLVVALGRDTRPSGPMLAHAVTAGLQACGVSVVDLGVASTPAIALMTTLLKAAGGVIITASHNPSQYNGIKFLQPIGTGLWAADALRLKGIWESRQFALAGAGELGKESRELRANGFHVDAVCATADVNGVVARHFKVVLDSINGAGAVEGPILLGRLGCEVAQINGEPTGAFAHTPEPIEENLTDLCAAVRRHRASVGFAQDPDADRLAIVDETGRFIGEEYTLALATAYVLSRRKGKVATNLVTSRMVDDIAALAGSSVVRAPTGEANVVGAMLAEGCILGGEGGGGVIDPRVGKVRDSLAGMAMVLQLMAQTGRPLSEIVRGLPAYVMIKTKLPCPFEAVDEILRRARAALAGRGAMYNDSDGLRADLSEGWVCVRASNTEPILRIIAEAKQRPAAEELIRQVREVVDAVLK
jgi:phosphomannomutase